jgi:hypothetical protein
MYGGVKEAGPTKTELQAVAEALLALHGILSQAPGLKGVPICISSRNNGMLQVLQRPGRQSDQQALRKIYKAYRFLRRS